MTKNNIKVSFNKNDNMQLKKINVNNLGGKKNIKNDSDDENNDNDSDSDSNLDENEDVDNINMEPDNDVEPEDIDEEEEEEEEENDDDQDNEELDDNIDHEETMGKKCLSKYNSYVLSDDEIDDYFPEDDGEMLIKQDKVSKSRLFDGERCALLCVRTKMLVLDAEPKIENSEGLTPKEIAKLELKYRTMPLKIGRQIPNGNLEIWKLSELEYSDED